MRTVGLWLGFSAVLAVASALLGWWALPVFGAVVGAGTVGGPGTVPFAALTGAAAWGLLLVWTAVQGPLGRMAEVLGGILGVPGSLTLLLALAFAALLTATGAGAAAAARRVVAKA